ncbi:MAG TPA: CHASE domain-containing protein [Acidimicrobiia bacterium]|nr:CHASE domain-containing protein [Acidimicrobiia bacterium]
MVHDSSGSAGPGSLTGFFGRPHRSTLVAVALVGSMVTIAGSWWLWSSEQAETTRALEARTQVVADSTRSALSDVSLRLAAVSGLFQASESVTEVEFRRFVRKFGLVPGLEAIGYMPLVMDRNRDEFEVAMRATIPAFAMFEMDESGNRIPARNRRTHVPLQWYEPIEAFDNIAGFDSLSDDDRTTALEAARVTRGMSLTPLIQLVTEEEADGFVMYWPVTDAASEALVGYAVAAMDLTLLMDGTVSGAMDPLLTWEVFDVTGQQTSPPVSQGTRRIDVGGRTWDVVITPAANSDMRPDPTAALLLLVTGLIATVIVTFGVHARGKQRSESEDFQKLRELTQAKDQFLASVGHELRTPLTSVLGFAEILRGDTRDLSEAERLTMISSVADEATDLASIVDDLLVSARSELDLLVVTEVTVSARAQVAQVLEASGRSAPQTIRVLGVPGDPYRALGDPGRVRQILRNLITNACRYGGETVEVRLHSNAEYVTIVIADNGAGVPAEDSEQIFSPYFRAHSRLSQPAALGIGLSVARQLARLMNGDLSYQRIDGWTCFEFSLPTVRDPEGRAYDVVADSDQPHSPVGAA